MSILLIVLGLLVVFGGFGAARAFRWRRNEQRMEERRQAKDELRRRHHFRGALDFELEKGPALRDRTEGQPEAD